MKASKLSRWRLILTAFTIWFLHFMACWAAGEIWPHQWPANVLAWGVTGIALLAVGVHFVRVNAQYADGDITGWDHRFAQRAMATATVAILFSAVPSVVFLP